MSTITLNNGIQMPQLGYGVFQIDNAQTERCVAAALEAGYRMIDTAQAYGNEEGVGAAVANSGVPREEVFLVDKVWVTNHGEGHALRSIEQSLSALGTDYIDLMLIHQPYGDYYGAYRDLERALESGKVRSIGVSNFDAIRTIDIAAFAGVVPAVNQIETHVFWQQKQNHEVMEGLGIRHMSWGPFAEGANGFFTNPVLSAIGAKRGRSVGQVALRYMLDLGVIVIPKSSRPERIAENFGVFDFSLADEDRAAIAALDQDRSIVFDHRDPSLMGGFLKGLGASRKQA